jgi:hypothetical protein
MRWRGSGCEAGSAMYVLTVLLLMVLLPVASIYADHASLGAAMPMTMVIGKWFVFWSGGARLVFAGLRQFFQPQFTSREIFGLTSDDALPIVRELGVANFAVGVVGMASLANPSFVLPVGISAAIFYGIAGVRHLVDGGRTSNETIAMITDLFVSAMLALYVGFVVVA